MPPLWPCMCGALSSAWDAWPCVAPCTRHGTHGHVWRPVLGMGRMAMCGALHSAWDAWPCVVPCPRHGTHGH
eukprot:351735-Chlamydomonas_euryale.AAC.1